MTGFTSAFSDSPGSETSTITFQLVGFFDDAGNPVAFAQAPEPALWSAPRNLRCHHRMHVWKPRHISAAMQYVVSEQGEAMSAFESLEL
jgi:hypothetical protein